MDLTGKHALVTGGGTGIGLAIAQALAGAGAQVTVTGRRAQVLARAEAQNITPRVMNVTDEASVTDAVAAAVAAHGPVQICVANAGRAEGKPLHRTELAFWRDMMAVNLDGAFLTIRECLGSMRQTGWGRVIAISSIAGIKGLAGAPAYTASKHGLTGLIRGLAADYLGQPFTFNALCPGYVDTNIVGENVARIVARTGKSEAEARALMVGANPHGRLIDAGEVAGAAMWLCSDAAGSVNGQAIEISGGQF